MNTIHCPSCDKLYKTNKSLHRHKTNKHPETIGVFHRMMQQYEATPNYCKCCGKVILYKKRHNLFCNSSCAAIYNNNHTSIESKIKRLNTWRTKLGVIQRDIPKVPNPYTATHQCCTCNTSFDAKCYSHVYCSPQCNTSKHAKAAYRLACKFTFSIIDYPDLYNLDLIKSNGWYIPSNKGQYNPDGVTWDHLFRISDGYSLNVDPSIMSHPANAEMISWRENINRAQSVITYNQLIHRINNWTA